MLKKNFNSNYSSKNSSFNRLNFPYLSHKPSEENQREKVIDLSSLLFSVENQSVTDTSSAAKFFKQSDPPKSSRTASHSCRTQNTARYRELGLNFTEKQVLNTDQIWEVSERLDSFKVRSENCPFKVQTQEHVSFQHSLWKTCSSEILSIIRQANTELSIALSTLFQKVFKLFEESEEIQKDKSQEFKEQLSEQERKLKKLQKELLKAKQENAEMKKFQKLDEETIKREVDEMFPNTDDEIKRLKDQSISLRSREFKSVPETLERIWNSMRKDEKLPEATDMDLKQFNSADIYFNLQENFKVVIGRTVRHVKNSLAPKVVWSSKETQTEEGWTDSSDFEEVQKSLEKTTLAYQSCLMQIDELKNDSYDKGRLLEKLENEREQARVELLQMKRELEQAYKELQSVRLENDSKVLEISALNKQNDEKTAKNIELELKIESLSEKILKISYELERTKQSLIIFSNSQMGEENNEDPSEDYFKNKVDDSKPNLNLREELEKMYMFGQRNKKSRENSDLNDINNEKAIIKDIGPDERKGNNEKITIREKERDGNILGTLKNNLEARSEVLPKNDAKLIADKVQPERSYEKEGKVNEDKTRNDNKMILESNESVGFIDIENAESNSDYEDIKINMKSKLIINKTNNSTKKKSRVKEERSPGDQSNENKISRNNEIAKKTGESKNLNTLDQSNKRKPVEFSKNPDDKKDSLKKEKAVKQSRVLANALKKVEKKNNQFTDPIISEKVDSMDTEENCHIISTYRFNEQPRLADRPEAENQELNDYQDKDKEKDNIEEPGLRSQIPIKPRNIKIKVDLAEDIQEINENYYEANYFQDSASKDIKEAKVSDSSNPKPSIPRVSYHQDKCCGSEFIEMKSLGTQVDLNKKTDETAAESVTYYLPYNPNNIYGLRGDVYYQKSSFQPQSRIPDLTSSLIFQPAYKFQDI